MWCSDVSLALTWYPAEELDHRHSEIVFYHSAVMSVARLAQIPYC